jgi:outer membrane protein assembly factor BamB/predicted phosphohydrolase
LKKLKIKYLIRQLPALVVLIFIESFMLSGQKPVTFALITDLHVSPGAVSDSALHRIVDEINNTDLDFIVVTGDISNSGSDAELYAVKAALDNLKKQCYLLPGNHETNWSESAGLRVNELWGNDRFAFDYDGFRFLGFNTGPFMKMGDGHVKQEDVHWLERQLQDKDLKNKVLISFSHYPLADGLDNWVQVTELLKSGQCRIDFCGHGHNLALLNFDGITGIMGRAVVGGKSGIPGYNIVKLRNDSVYVYNKELNNKSGKPAIAMNYMNPVNLQAIPVSIKPDYSVNKKFTNRRVVAEFTDTASIFSGPCLVDDTILVVGNSIGIIKAINTLTGKILWQLAVKGPVYSTPVFSDGIVTFGTVDGYIIGLDAYSGKKIWSLKAGGPILSEGVIENGSLFIGGGEKTFFRINIRTGRVQWIFGHGEGLIQGKVALSDNSVIFGAWDTYLYCLDKNTGILRWKWDNGKPQKLYSPGNIFPVCSEGKVFIVAPDRFMTAIDIITGKEVWRTGRHQVRESMGASPDGSMIFAKLMNDSIIAVSATGNISKTVWSVNAGFGYEHNPCPLLITNDLAIAGTRSGNIIAVERVAKKVLWNYKAGNSSVNKVVVDKHQTFWFTLMEGKIIGIRTTL